jgi:ArsR family transcriptional regulator
MSLEALEMVAIRFKVLSDPMRLRILQLLEEKETSVSELAEAAGATQPNVSKHLKILHGEGLLSRRQEGNTVYYSVSDPRVFELCEVVCSCLHERFAAHANAFDARVRTTARRKKSRTPG